VIRLPLLFIIFDGIRIVDYMVKIDKSTKKATPERVAFYQSFSNLY